MAKLHEAAVSQSMVGVPSSSQPHSQGQFTMPFAPGELINGKYEVVELIGVGGLGFVVAANHVELGEKVALKFLRPEAMSNAEAVSRFSREARASAKLRSEHVARVFDVGTLPDGSPFIVMEYLDGTDLGVLLHERGALPVTIAVEYVLQTCEALATAHASGVVHRDIKPDNLFLNRRAQDLHVIKVLDFGISKVSLARTALDARQTRHPLVETTMAMGSPIYMSPEQIRAAKDIDARTDIWSLGCVLYELLTNRLAFDASTVTEVTALILERETPSLRTTRPDVPDGLDVIIQRCLAKHPAQRYQNVAELAVALAPFALPRARVLVERCCTILQSTGMTRAGIERFRSPPPPAPDSLIGGPVSADAASTATVEAPARSIPSPSKSWPLAVGALILVLAGAGGLLVRQNDGDAGNGPTPSPLTAPAAAAPSDAPSSPPPVALPPPAAAPATPARAVTPTPSEPAASPNGAAGASPTLAGEPVPPGAKPPEASAIPPTAAEPSEPQQHAETPKPKPAQAAPARRRVTPPPPKPKPAPPPRSIPAPQEEPDIGF